VREEPISGELLRGLTITRYAGSWRVRVNHVPIRPGAPLGLDAAGVGAIALRLALRVGRHTTQLAN
jgi:hypothetical protein